MKKVLLIGALALTMNGLSQVPDYVPTDSLVGWWPFNGDADDESGKDNHGVVSGATLIDDRDGNATSAYDFDGVDDNISLGNPPELDFQNTDSFSIQLWVKSDLLGSPGMLFSNIDDVAPYIGYEIYTNTAGTIGVYMINDFGAGNYIQLQTVSTPLSDGLVHHLVITYDGSLTAAGVNIYVDKELETFTTLADNLTGNIQNLTAVNIGSRNQACCYEAAEIDDIGVWNRVITTCEIIDLYNAELFYGTDVQTACISYEWLDGITYTADNNTATFKIDGGAANGCDSLVKLDLTINTVDIGITEADPMLSSNATGAIYQWLDCGNSFAEISGATNQNFTATAVGSFAVEVTENGCTDTSACSSIVTLGLDDTDVLFNNVTIYPNPSSNNDQINIDLTGLMDVAINVFSVNGQLLYHADEINNIIHSFELAEEPGVYFIELSTSGDNKIFNLIKI
jgi:Concanavalin A-like lectin/glucanases superfamily